MKKLLLSLLLLVNVPVILAPESGGIFIIVNNTIKYTRTPQDWLQAMIQVESGDKGSRAYNPKEPQAVGILQIWPITVRDCNRILGYKKYTLKDRLNDKKSIEMFWVYQKYYNPKLDPYKMARIWCGGPDGHKEDCTLEYLQRVKDVIYN